MQLAAAGLKLSQASPTASADHLCCLLTRSTQAPVAAEHKETLDGTLKIGHLNSTLNPHVQVGRAGRFGTKGLAITFVASETDSAVLNSVQVRL